MAAGSRPQEARIQQGMGAPVEGDEVVKFDEAHRLHAVGEQEFVDQLRDMARLALVRAREDEPVADVKRRERPQRVVVVLVGPELRRVEEVAAADAQALAPLRIALVAGRPQRELRRRMRQAQHALVLDCEVAHQLLLARFVGDDHAGRARQVAAEVLVTALPLAVRADLGEVGMHEMTEVEEGEQERPTAVLGVISGEPDHVDAPLVERALKPRARGDTRHREAVLDSAQDLDRALAHCRGTRHWDVDDAGVARGRAARVEDEFVAIPGLKRTQRVHEAALEGEDATAVRREPVEDDGNPHGAATSRTCHVSPPIAGSSL